MVTNGHIIIMIKSFSTFEKKRYSNAFKYLSNEFDKNK